MLVTLAWLAGPVIYQLLGYVERAWVGLINKRRKFRCLLPARGNDDRGNNQTSDTYRPKSTQVVHPSHLKSVLQLHSIGVQNTKL